MDIDIKFQEVSMEKEFTGYIIRDDYDLNNLARYGFTKTKPVDVNPWWQRPINIFWHGIDTWDTELLVSKEDRKLMQKVRNGADVSDLRMLIGIMLNDGVFANA